MEKAIIHTSRVRDNGSVVLPILIGTIAVSPSNFIVNPFFFFPLYYNIQANIFFEYFTGFTASYQFVNSS